VQSFFSLEWRSCLAYTNVQTLPESNKSSKSRAVHQGALDQGGDNANYFISSRSDWVNELSTVSPWARAVRILITLLPVPIHALATLACAKSAAPADGMPIPPASANAS